ncbi:YraN family protein [Polycladidibacter hongkongensis]|uniref:YraN family protein n=1 Tax=Polycladidibacter hongkongensis TaxID=1647556 RepID=UPI000829DA4B|nr:YraN family protein [Pseudovibrio hongkongensis]
MQGVKPDRQLSEAQKRRRAAAAHLAHSPQERAQRRGLAAEALAKDFLEQENWHILAQRYKCSAGEIDLIATRADTLCFFEVKARQSIEVGLHAVSPRAQRRIERASRIWLSQQTGYELYSYRYDLLVVLPSAYIHHLPCFFEGG